MHADVKKIREEFGHMPAHVTAEIIRLMEPLNNSITELRVEALGQDENVSGLENKNIAL
jgi:hypothetical protein